MSEEFSQHLVIVSGRAERKVAPDRARWAISVEANAQSHTEAFR